MNTNSVISDQLTPSLLARVAAGKQFAVEECLDRYGGLVWSLARRFCNNLQDSEDAVQEIFTDLWKNAARFDPKVASETTFVAMIARRRLIDHQRKQGRQPNHVTLDSTINEPNASEHSELEVIEEAARVEDAMGNLQPKQREALRLSIYDNCSHAQIAQQLEQPVGTVKTNIRRGLLKVREMLGEETEGDL
jgi:RNA polymerase sigma-70 factor (ECF subfamily)